MHPFCACNPSGVPPPPSISPPPSPGSTGDYEFVSMGSDLDPTLGYAGAFVRRIANERAFPGSDVSTTTHFRCDKDQGVESCARFCAADQLGNLRAFTVTGEHVSPPPPAPPGPPRPAMPPKVPGVFNGCSNACAAADQLTQCHDGGHGSYYPPICDYGSQVQQLFKPCYTSHHSPNQTHRQLPIFRLQCLSGLDLHTF